MEPTPTGVEAEMEMPNYCALAMGLDPTLAGIIVMVMAVAFAGFVGWQLFTKTWNRLEAWVAAFAIGAVVTVAVFWLGLSIARQCT